MGMRIAATVIGVGIALAAAGCAPAGDGPGRLSVRVHAPDGSDAGSQVKDRLAATIPQLVLRAAPLDSVLRTLGETGQVTISANWKAIEQAGLTRRTPVTMQLPPGPLERALSRVLTAAAGRENVLGFAVIGEGVSVSTIEDLSAGKFVQIYDCRILFESAPWLQVDRLLEVLRRNCAPESWAPAGEATIFFLGELLVIRQSPVGHRQVEMLLNQLARAVEQRTGDGRRGDQVLGIHHLRQSSKATAILLANGFVVADETRRRIEEFYDRPSLGGLPPLVTTDVMLHAWNVLYGQSLRALEKQQAARMKAWQDGLWNRLAADPGAPTLNQAELTHLRGLVAVAQRLLDANFKPGSVALPGWVDQEVRAIQGDAKPADSPAWGRRVDYRGLRPPPSCRGDEQLERFFRARAWWSRHPFRLSVDGEVRLAVELARLAGVEPGQYRALAAPYLRLVGAADGPDLADLHRAAAKVAGEGRAVLPEHLPGIVAELKKSFQPAAAPARGQADCVYVFAPPYLFESELFTRMTGPASSAALKGHAPGGLDLMAALGSQTARKLLLARTPPPLHPPLTTQLDQAGSTWKTDEKTSLLTRQHCRVLQMLHSPDIADNCPPFMHTEPYQRKSLQTGLAGWVEARPGAPGPPARAARPPASAPGEDDGDLPGLFPPGFVEPNVEFWQRLIDLASLTRRQMKTLHPDHDDRWAALGEMLRRCRELAETLLDGGELSAEQGRFIRSFGPALRELLGSPGPGQPAEPVWACVHRGQDDGSVFIGAGLPQAIYAVFPYRNGKWLCKGGVMTYREHAPDSRGLTDLQWQQMLARPDGPAQPAWTRGFCLPPGAVAGPP